METDLFFPVNASVGPYFNLPLAMAIGNSTYVLLPWAGTSSDNWAGTSSLFKVELPEITVASSLPTQRVASATFLSNGQDNLLTVANYNTHTADGWVTVWQWDAVLETFSQVQNFSTPAEGGLYCTNVLIWPSGKLLIACTFFSEGTLVYQLEGSSLVLIQTIPSSSAASVSGVGRRVVHSISPTEKIGSFNDSASTYLVIANRWNSTSSTPWVDVGVETYIFNWTGTAFQLIQTVRCNAKAFRLMNPLSVNLDGQSYGGPSDYLRDPVSFIMARSRLRPHRLRGILLQDRDANTRLSVEGITCVSNLENAQFHAGRNV